MERLHRVCVIGGGSEYVMYRGIETHRRGSGGGDGSIVYTHGQKQALRAGYILMVRSNH